VKITISDGSRVVRTLDGTKNAGINRVWWNLTETPQPGQQTGRGGGRGGFAQVTPGVYQVTIEAGGKKITKPMEVLKDEWLSER
jgi:hypothetical protein